jgi:uncharacterized protein (DUF427 family)
MAVHGGAVVLDTTRALYVWEWANYPQFYIPRQDVREGLLLAGDETEDTPLGTVRLCSLAAGSRRGGTAARLLVEAVRSELADTFRFEWEAVDHWFEEGEEVFVHPRNPYARVDALRSTRIVRTELDAVLLAESSSPVMAFEAGLPTRHYLNRTEVGFEYLVTTATVTRCPYKGTTSTYWSAAVGGTTRADGLELRLPHPPAAADRRTGVVLQRAGRRLRRRCPAGAPEDPLLRLRRSVRRASVRSGLTSARG